MRKIVGAFAAVACLVVAAFAGGGCASEDEKADAQRAAIPGGDLVRGMSGIAPDTDPTTAEEKMQVAIADELVGEIETMFPRRLASIDAELKSRDGDRVQKAKILLDATIAIAAESPALRRRVREMPEANSLTTNGLHALDMVNGASGPLVDGGQQLLCEDPRGPDGQPLRLGAVNGTYGDGRTGPGAAARDTGGLVDTNDWNVVRTLRRVDSGELVPDPESRLGAYAATRGYPPGTVGYSVHNAIGTIFVTFGNYGEERIGRVFNSPEARALYNQPVSSCAGQQMAVLEYQYWRDVAAEDGWSPGGRMGSAFNPATRDLLQRRVFNLF